jgi:hypothetical protein
MQESPVIAAGPAWADGGRWRGRLAGLGSLRFALANLLALLAGVWAVYLDLPGALWALVLPLFSSAVNLLAAIAVNRAFRRQLPLLVFHLALLAIVLLVALGRLTYLRGSVEIVDGGEFDGTLTTRDAGPWHAGRLAELRFANLGFSIDYDPGLKRGATKNEVAWRDANGFVQRQVIGDQTPLLLAGYRFYTSFNKGYAPTFAWHPAAGGDAVLGAVHLPSYPLNEYEQAREWTIPGTNIPIWTMLRFDEVVLDPDKADYFKLPGKHAVIVRIGDARWELQPGGSIALPTGRLEYAGVRGWMGYSVFYDWTVPWLLAAAMSAVLALGWHYWRKFAARPWDGVNGGAKKEVKDNGLPD